MTIRLDIRMFCRWEQIKPEGSACSRCARGCRCLSLLLCLVLFLLAACQAPPPRNVLLITIDTLRPDHLSCYGYERNTSPNIDRIAAEGTLYRNVFCQFTSTTPSHSSILTGLTPDVHGVLTNWDRLALRFDTVTEILGQAGFRTGAVVGNWSLKKERGLNQGFDYYDDFMPEKELHRPLYQKHSRQSTENALFWLEKNKESPFFLWVNYMDPHGPYTAPPPYNGEFAVPERSGKGGLPFSGKSNAPHSIPAYQRLGDANSPEYYTSQYDGEIKYTDHWVGQLLAKIRNWGLMEKTLIIITSDHGESLGEHDYYFMHSNLTYKEQAAVPLIIRYPGLFSEGEAVDARIETIDFMPTILDACQIKSDPELKGKSLLNLSREIPGKPIVVLSEKAKRISVYKDEWELVLLDKRATELYNIKSDGQEKDNLMDTSAPEVIETLTAVAEPYFGTRKPDAKSGLTEKEKQVFKSLGYIN